MKETQFSFRSQILGNERLIWIQQPEAQTSPTKLLMILDGELYRDRMGAADMIQRLVEEKRIEPTLVVYVSYGSEAARWIECPCYPPFAQFIIDELYPRLVSQFPELDTIEERIIVGLSYTGLAASYVAIESKGLFQKVISQSGSYWSDDCWLSKKVEALDRKLELSVYLDVGDQETDTNVKHKEDVLQKVSQISSVERFRDALSAQGIQTEYTVFKGGHSFDAWAKTLPVALQWALGSNNPSPE